jgi:hypothetical protein
MQNKSIKKKYKCPLAEELGMDYDGYMLHGSWKNVTVSGSRESYGEMKDLDASGAREGGYLMEDLDEFDE